MLNNMKIGKKLILTFALLVLISSTEGIVGFVEMTSMNSGYSNALTSYGFSQGDIGLFHAEFNDSRTIIRDVVFSTDSGETNTSIIKLNGLDAKTDNYFTSMKKTMVTKNELSYYNDIKNNLAEYRTVSDKVIALAQENKNKEAQTLLTDQGTPLCDKIAVSINALIAEKTTAGNQIATNLSSMGTTAQVIIFVVILVAILLSLFIAQKIAHSISKPVKQMAEAARRMAQGDLNVQISTNSKDEIGQLGAAFAESAASIRTYIADITNVLGEMEHGNLTVVSELDYLGDYVDLKDSCIGIQAFLNDILGQINKSAVQVSSDSEQVSNGAQTLAQGATEQASSIQELSATIFEIASNVKNNAISAADASGKVNKVSTELKESNQHMQEMIAAMAKINDSSSKIGKIIKAIEDIAFQTNILALNAAVEAARAGEAGKGFAVVADEVRNLASKCADAAKETTALIQNSIKEVEYGTKITNQTATALMKVVGDATAVATAVDCISQTSNQQATSINQVSLGVEQISSVVQTNSATAEESAAASEELSKQAQTMKTLVGKFTLKKLCAAHSEENICMVDTIE